MSSSTDGADVKRQDKGRSVPPRRVAVMIQLLLAGSIFCLVQSLRLLGSAAKASDDYTVHYEATPVVLDLLSLFVLAFLLLWLARILWIKRFGRALLFPRGGGSRRVAMEWIDLAFLLTLMVLFRGIHENSILFSIFDHRGSHLHPYEAVLFPSAPWLSMPDLLASHMVLIAALVFLWLACGGSGRGA